MLGAQTAAHHVYHWPWKSLRQFEFQSRWPAISVWSCGQSQDTSENRFPNGPLEDWLPITAIGTNTIKYHPKTSISAAKFNSFVVFTCTKLFFQSWHSPTITQETTTPSDCCSSQQTHTLFWIKQSYSTLFSFKLKLLCYTILYREMGRKYAASILLTLMNTETIKLGLFWWVLDSGSINNRSNITKFKIGSLLDRLVIQRKKEAANT